MGTPSTTFLGQDGVEVATPLQQFGDQNRTRAFAEPEYK
jgi:hypothetical protein